jgi:hypothetical protein
MAVHLLAAVAIGICQTLCHYQREKHSARRATEFYVSNLRTRLLTAAALVSAVSVIGSTSTVALAATRPHATARVTASPKTVIGTGLGDGTTSALAQRNALRDLRGNFFGCVDVTLVYDVGGGNSWNAEVSATCGGYN